MVEFQLFQGGEGAVALLDELEPPPVGLSEIVEPVAARRRLAQERPGDEDDGGDREHRGEDERERHAMAAPAA